MPCSRSPTLAPSHVWTNAYSRGGYQNQENSLSVTLEWDENRAAADCLVGSTSFAKPHPPDIRPDLCRSGDLLRVRTLVVSPSKGRAASAALHR